VLEAMACGAPVVASDTDGLREVVDDGRSGLLMPVDDPAALARAVLRLLHDEQLRSRLVAGGHALTCGRGVDRMVAQTKRLYRSLLRRPVAAPIVDDDPVGLVLTGEGHTA
jgi:glycosyltransferase involved in cell wall biosynthesis